MFEEPPLGPMPVEDPAWVAQREAWWASDECAAMVAAERDAELAAMGPADRFEAEYGLPATPEHGFFAAPRTEDAAAAAQDALVDLDRVARLADAHRVVALLDAYRVTVEDLEARFSARLARRDGLGVQAFLRSVGLRLQLHPAVVAHQLDTALVAEDRLPATWAVFLAGGTTWRRIDLAVKHLQGLDPANHSAYDDAAAGIVADSTRPADALRRVRERLQDDTAAKRAKSAFELRNVVLEEGRDGQASLIITGPAVDLVPYKDALHRAAVAAHGIDGETRSRTALEYDIVRDSLLGTIRRAPDGTITALAVPARKPVDVRLILTIPALAWLGRTKEQAVLGGYGPIDLHTAKSLAGSAKSMIRVLTDPVTGVRTTMDRTSRTPPVDLARWVKIRDGRSRFPGGRRSAWLSDIDHAREWYRDAGGTNEDNLICLARPEHNLKSLDLFTPDLRADTSVGWADAWGNHFVDPPPDPMDPAPPSLLPDEPPF